MKLRELEEFLLKEGIRKEAVGINTSGGLGDQYRIEQSKGKWVVYYFSERGTVHGLQEFPNEDLACDYLAEILRKDKSAHVGTKSVYVTFPRTTS